VSNLADCLRTASAHWDDRKGSQLMVTYARRCVEIVGGSAEAGSLGVSDAVRLLGSLRDQRLSAKTVSVYYSAFRRMLALNGVDTLRWPKAPTPPRKTREPMKGDDLDALIEWLDGRYRETGDLARLLRGTGARVAVEGLDTCGGLRWEPPTDETPSYGVLHVTGKGGHQRSLPVVDTEAVAVLSDQARMVALQGTSYAVHLKRWGYAVKALGISTKLPTPHSVRHYYATEAYRKSGGNLVMVQELLGHSDPATTARYLGVDMSDKARALANV
jgi:integrase